MRRVKALLMLVFLGLLPAATAQVCDRFSDKTTVKESIEYLERARNNHTGATDAQCVTAAIKRLEYQSSPHACAVLTQFLDFKRPLTELEKHGFSRPNNPASEYPAISTLSSFGEAAVPCLVAEIEISTSKLIQQNAVFTLITIFREQPEQAVRVLMSSAARSTGDPAARLRESAQLAIQMCGTRRPECEKVISIEPNSKVVH